VQVKLELAPAASEYLPASHDTQVAELTAVTVVENLPAGHSVHVCASSNEYPPAGQASTPTVTALVSARVSWL
jgi:hypothetical protein